MVEIKAYLLLLLVAFVPLVGAANTEFVETYPVDILSGNASGLDQNTTVFNKTFNGTAPHNYEVAEHRFEIEVSLSLSHRSSADGVWNFTMKLDNSTIAGNCHFEFETIDYSALGNDLVHYSGVVMFCLSPITAANASNEHELKLLMTEQNGTPAPIDALGYSVRINREDIYMVPQDANEMLEFMTVFGGLIVALAIVLFAAAQPNRLLEAAGMLIAGVIVAIQATTMEGEYEEMRLALGLVALLLLARGTFTGVLIRRDI